MSLNATWYRDKLRKKAKRGFQGYPVATVTYYGPDDQHASKVAVGIIFEAGGDVAVLQRWYNDVSDIRRDAAVNAAILELLKQHGVKSVVSPNRILGCPHEEGTDYPDGEPCPTCSYWAIRDRFTGEVLQ